MQHNKTIMYGLYDLLNDRNATVRNTTWICRHDVYLVRITRDNLGISVHKHIVPSDGAPLIPLQLTVPLSDPNCFEKVVDEVRRIVDKHYRI
jgi:hypothetical protein